MFSKTPDCGDSVDFETVRMAECDEIKASRVVRNEKAPGSEFGVALSGGGIRSAAFNLGVLEGLAWRQLLSQVDYLSTISGGGYIGSWLISWIHRSGVKKVEQDLHDSVEQRIATGTRYMEPNPVRWMRQYTSYLVPKAGLAGGDLWATVAIYLRNVLLTQLILVGLCVCGLIAPMLLVALGNRVWAGGSDSLLIGRLSIAVPGALVAVAFYAAAQSFRKIKFKEENETNTSMERGSKASGYVFVYCMVGSAALSNLWLLPIVAMTPRWQIVPGLVMQGKFGELGSQMVDAGIGIVFFLLLPVVTGTWPLVFKSKKLQAQMESVRPSTWPLVVSPVIAATIATAVESALFYWISRSATPSAYSVMFGVPVTMLVICLTSFLHIGLMGNAFEDAFREWLARACGYLMFGALVWMIVASISIYAPLGVEVLSKSDWGHKQMGTVLKWLLPGGWVATTLAGVLGGHSAATNGGSQKKLDLVTKLTPPVFILGLLVALSWGTFRLNPDLHGYYGKVLASHEVHVDKTVSLSVNAVLVSFDDCLTWVDWRPVMLMLLGAGVLFLGVGQAVDINEFSMHLYYKNRLTRTFLGASHEKRKPNKFTGFDPNDDIHLSRFRTKPLEPAPEEKNKPRKQSPYYGPYPLFGTALNVVKGDDLAMQTRKARSFLYSPLFVGFDHVASDATADCPKADGYRQTEMFSGKYGPHVGTAMTISGAAASPNSGYHTDSAVAALMTFFNVRLGWWAGNPTHRTAWRKHGPKGPMYLFNELVTKTNDSSAFVYLSDGGHFENLGIYELVRRRVKYILASDADQDENFGFGDLGGAVEKCRRDFGVEITFRSNGLTQIPRDNDGVSKQPFALADICYPPIGKETAESARGTLLYMKTTLPGGCPVDVQAYAKAHVDFPHDPTANQFFDENQFESYRRLGETICRSALEFSEVSGERIDFDALFKALETKIPPKLEPPTAVVHGTPLLVTGKINLSPDAKK